ncbi:MAG: zinc ribbon domain-containing protein [Chloroflexi bacterium]|nr:zinc ribbon domain-containing protein [Chloroflexota bacterium]
MKCSNCKQVIPDGTKFCPNCGAKVEVQETPPQLGEGQTKWQKALPLIGAGIGMGSGFIALMGWFSHWTSMQFGNGPQLIALPFGLTAGSNLLQSYPALSSVFQSVDEITGWVLLISILLAIISIILVIMCGLSIWQGVKCLEYRADPALLPTVKNSINKIGNFTITGIVFVVAVMVLVSIFQFGQSAIGGGLVAMAFGFIAGFIAVIYLKPHLR